LGKSVRQVIPPPRNGVLNLPKKKNRFRIIWSGETWKNRENCHQGSLNEVVMFRYKTIFSGELKAREMKNQITGVKLKCMILNRFSKTGMSTVWNNKKSGQG
jgi:hypothetical protein